MKTLKKISLVYFLQLVAVLLLFGYKDVSPPIQGNELKSGKFPAVNVSADSLLQSKLPDLQKLYMGKSW
jgi:hypothetical protein